MQIQVKAVKKHPYGGKTRSVGEVYPVPGQSDLRLLEAIGWVKRHTPEPAPVAVRFDPPVRQKAPTPAPAPAPIPVEPSDPPVDDLAQDVPRPPAAKRGSRYQRRDLTAEE